MKITCISDLHGQLPEIEETSLLLISGDICPANNHDISYQASWLDTNFRNWLSKTKAKDIVACWGNHDFIGQDAPHRVPSDLRWHLLEETSIEIGGLKIWGSAFSNWFYDWAFNAPRENGEMFLARLYADVPENTDIIVTHGPPWGGHPQHYHEADLTRPFKGNPPQHVGSHSLLDRMKVVHPTLLVTGHIHGGYGVYDVELSEGNKGQWPCFVTNASVLNEQYVMTNDPIVFEWDEKNRNLAYLHEYVKHIDAYDLD